MKRHAVDPIPKPGTTISYMAGVDIRIGVVTEADGQVIVLQDLHTKDERMIPNSPGEFRVVD